MSTLTVSTGRRAPRFRRPDNGTLASWLLRSGVVTVSGLALTWNPYDKPAAHLWMGIAILVLSLWPLDRWLRVCGRRTIPIFELHLFFYAVCFGLAAFIDPPKQVAYSLGTNEQSYTLGLEAALLGIGGLYMGYFVSRLSRGTLLARLAPRFPARIDAFSILYIYPVALVGSLFVQHLHVSALAQILPAFRLFAFAWALCAVWSGAVRKVWLRVAMVAFVPIELFAFSGLLTGHLAGILIYGELIVVLYALCKGRILIWIAIAGVTIFAVLQPIKGQFRDIVWHQETGLSAAQRADLMTDMTLRATRTAAATGSVSDMLQTAYARLGQLTVSSAYIQATQRTGDYLDGGTYLPILTKWIPRALWPGKPAPKVGNDLGRAYGLLGQRDYTTALNLPWLPEMFMNFGWTGVVVVSTLVGWFIGLLKRGIMDRVRSPVEIAFAYSLAAGFLYPESNMSLGVGGMIIAWISISALLLGVSLTSRIALRHPAKAQV